MQTLSNTIPVIYKNNFYQVDPNILCQVSLRFNNLLRAYFEEGEIGQPQLEILCENFTERGIENFLKICQNLQTDVQNSEIKEICEIASMFQANDIYNKALAFVQQTIDPNFDIPENKYDNTFASRFLHLTTIGKLIHHLSDFSYLEFDSDDLDEYNNSQDINQINNIPTMTYIEQSQASNELPALYSIKEEALSRGQRLILVKNNKTIMSAKVKGRKVYISNKEDFSNSGFTPVIERDSNLNSKVTLNGQEMYIKYILVKNTNFSIETSFKLDDKMVSWCPKDIKMKKKSIEYKTLMAGRYNHSFKRSPINVALKNKNGETEYILRKIGHNSFEAECNPKVPAEVVFSIAISQIVGPYFDTMDVLTSGKEKVVPTVPFSIA